VYKSVLLLMLVLWLIQPMHLMATEIIAQPRSLISTSISNPMRPPKLALDKYQQAIIKSKPKTVVVNKEVVKPKVVKLKPLKLTSILYSSTRKVAIIDEKLLNVGDHINGARLVKIEKNNVYLISNGKTINLPLSNQSTNIQKTVVQKTTGQKRL
jgi:hypothetical protein